MDKRDSQRQDLIEKITRTQNAVADQGACVRKLKNSGNVKELEKATNILNQLKCQLDNLHREFEQLH